MEFFRFFVLLIVLLFTLLDTSAQEVVFEKEIKLKRGIKEDRSSFPIVNGDELALFLFDHKQIHGLLLDQNYEQINELTTAKPEGKFEDLLGYSIDQNGYHLFFTNNKKNQFITKSFNFNNKESTETVQEIFPYDEKFLECISYKNRFYIITIYKNSSVLNLYAFEGSNKLNMTQIYLEDHKFADSDYAKLFDVLTALSSMPKLHKVDYGNPNPLSLTSEQNKLYCYDNKIIITLDNENYNTKIIRINLEDFSYQLRNYEKGEIAPHNNDYYNYKQSNSYLYNDYLYQISGSLEELYFSISKLETKALVKEYRVNKEEEITFNSTPIMQVGGTSGFTMNANKELGKTKKILSKIASSEIGVTAYAVNDTLEITLGGYMDVQIGSGIGMAGVPGSMGVSVETSRSVTFKTLLDNATFQKLEGNVSKKKLSEAEVYSKKNGYDIIAKTTVKIDDYFILGYYDKLEKKYYLKKFKD